MDAMFTIGHSTLSISVFLQRLEKAEVTAVADVRSSPFSRRFHQYNKDNLQFSLASHKIKYVFLGNELGGRPNFSSLYEDGVANYEKMALETSFLTGIDRVISGARRFNIVLMCSEHNPLDCHRCLLVARALNERGEVVDHILGNGDVLSHDRIEEQLLTFADKGNNDMFLSQTEKLNKAYRSRSKLVAYRQDH